MRHYKRGRKLGTDASHTKAIKKSLVANLFLNDRVKTTLERAKEIRGDVDRIVTWAKRGDVHSRRLAIAALGDKMLVAEIFSKVEQGLFEGRQGGYTRILRLGTRRGDAATIVIMELVQEPVSKKEKSGKDKPKSADSAKSKSGAKVPVVEKIEEAFEKAESEADEAVDEAAEVDEEATDEADEAASDDAASDDAAEEAAAEEVAEADEVAEVAEEAVETTADEAADAAEADAADAAEEAADEATADTAKKTTEDAEDAADAEDAEEKSN